MAPGGSSHGEVWSVNQHGKLFGGVVIDITQRKEAELALLENEKRFRFLADAIPHKLWTSNPDSSVNYYNQGWYDYTGIKSFDELKAVVWDFIHPDDRKIIEVEWPKAIKLGENKSFEHRLRRYDGEYRWHLSRFSAHRNDKGEILLWVDTSTDIQEQKANEQRKDEFQSIASHELKTPLTSIKAFNQIMARTATEGNLSKFIDKSAEHIFRLERLIADLLDVTKINAGKLVYNSEQFPLKEVLLHAKENFPYNETHDIIIKDSADVIVKEEGYIVIKSLPENFRKDIYQFRPALILLDHWLYKALGSTICENLKTDPETCSIPIILTSTVINIKDLASCCKADDALPKPFDVEVLVEKVSRLMPIPK